MASPSPIPSLAAAVALVASATTAAAAQECILIATGGTNTLTVFDLKKNLATAQIPVGRLPISVAASADGRFAFTADNEGDTVSVVDLQTGTTVETIAVGDAPTDLALHPSGERLYVTDRNDHRVSVIDVAAGRVLGTIAVGAGPSGIAVSADGRRAYTANFLSSTVSVVDLEQGRVVATIPVGEQPFGLDLSPDGSRLYVANTVSESLSVVRTEPAGVVTTIDLGVFPSDVAVAPDGTAVYVSGAFPDGNVSVIDAGTNALRVTIPVEDGAELSAIATNDDGSLVFVVDFIFANVYFVDPVAERTVGFEPVGGTGRNPEGMTVTTVPGGCPVPPTPRLAEDIDAAAVVIRVDRPDALPVAGTVRIDAELVTYQSLRFDRLEEVARGVRRTEAASHAAGTPVLLVGLPGDANCDGLTSAADLIEQVRALPSGDPGLCGGDLTGDGAVTADDIPPAIARLFEGSPPGGR